MNIKMTGTTIRTLTLTTLLFAAALPLALAEDAHQHHHHHDSAGDMNASRPAALSGQSIYNIDSTWKNQEGRDMKLASLRGKPTVIAMLYTSCQGACPLTIADLKRIETGLDEATKAKVRFAIFSFDSERDKPERLKEFASSRGLDTSRWALFNGKPADVRKLAAVLGIRFKKLPGGDYDHSNVITIVDRDGLIVHQQIGLRQDTKESIEHLSKIGKD